MKNIITSLIILSLILSCKKDKPAQSIDSTNTFKDEYFKDNLIYNENNFKDRTKTFKLENGNSIISNKQTQKIGDIYYTATMMPVEYYLKKNLKNKDSINFYKNKLKGERVVQFEFQHKDRKDLLDSEFTKTDYTTAVKYLAFKIKNDFYAITQKGDTLKCKGVLFERNFKLAPFKRVLVYFKDSEEINNLRIIYNDNLFENGIIKFNLIN